MRRAAVLSGVALSLLVGCNDEVGLLRAKPIEARGELVGGPVAIADIGDYILENDEIRVAVLTARDSPGPGLFGGSIVDVDRRRGRLDATPGQGHDRFAELFPIANLLVPEPDTLQVTVGKDGSDGQEASIHVEGKGAFLFEALSLLETQKDALSLFFPDVKSRLTFKTDYVLHPGDHWVTVRTTLIDDDPLPATCTAPTCSNSCPAARKTDAMGCVTCDCDEPRQLDVFSTPQPVFGGILGDDQSQPDHKKRAGLIAGDFVFFGNQNDVFAPGFGFDEDRGVNDAFYAGRNTFVDPLALDFVAASGGDISYGYMNAPKAAGDQSVVDVPLITSAATAFLIAGQNCLFDPSDDASCDSKRGFTYERYLLVGDGDVASVAEQVYHLRNTATGGLSGVVTWSGNGEPAAHAHVFLLRDPDPKRDWATVDDVVEQNRRDLLTEGVLNAIDCDRGLDPVLDGDFSANVAPGDYLLVATDADGQATSAPVRAHVGAGQSVVANPTLPLPATINYRVSDATASYIPAKITMVALDDAGNPLERDGRRRVYLGGSRYADGVRHIEYEAKGTGTFRVEAGRYRVVVSRGPEYGIFVLRDVTLAPGAVLPLDAALVREVDTTGYMSADMHLHSKPSFDSGMPIEKRIRTIAAEDVEFALPTDHDSETDYGPTLRAMGMQQYFATAVSAETTTLEQGHFIAFPQRYDETNLATHGSHDWTCEAGEQIFQGLRSNADPSHDQLLIVAHPRDGFFGYVDQLGVEPSTLDRTTPSLEANNPLFATAGCDFDAMELINGKRFDIVRTATVGETVDYNRCRARIDAAKSIDELKKACPEIKNDLLAPCATSERFVVCQERNRSELAFVEIKRILARTPEEQAANWAFTKTVADAEALCDLGKLGDKVLSTDEALQPCLFHQGQVDDYFRYLERGFRKGQVASSDSHDAHIEPGFPRTYFASAAESPAGLSIDDAVAALRAGKALTTYGPFVRASLGNATFGDTAQAAKGSKVDLKLHVESASWFGVDRVEVYVNGALTNVLSPATGPEAIVDLDQSVSLDVPDRDSWVVVIAMGLKDKNLLRPVSLDVPFGEIQLARVVGSAFAAVPALKSFFALTPALPDFFPIVPYAVTNAIYIDTDGNGTYDAPLPAPPFCSIACDKATVCPGNQICLNDSHVCGYPIKGKCDKRRAPFGFAE